MGSKIKLLTLLAVLTFCSVAAQQNSDSELEKSNPIIYIDIFGGGAVLHHGGVGGGFELNYQYKKNLFSARYTNASGYTRDENIVLIIPDYYRSENIYEYALLYGRRWLWTNHSYSISAGISRNNLELAFRDLENNRHVRYKNFYGVPFEANYKWFYKRKKSKIIYNAMIPSVGVKLFGNIGEYSFVGAGVTVGFGFSKRY